MGVAASLSGNLCDVIITRLAQQTYLRVPGQLDQSITVEKRFKYLRNLITHDPGVFLERHGDALNAPELDYFQALRSSSYEVDFYMKILEDKAATTSAAATDTPGAHPPPPGGAKRIANRRLAKLEILEQQGYFRMEAMRSREPYLYHLYIGKYIDQPFGSIKEENAVATENAPTSGTSTAIAQLTESILEKHDQLDLMIRSEAEREALRLIEEETESEEEEEEEEDDEAVAAKGVETFLDTMKQKFLSGQDTSINYTQIDADTSLDEHFADLERRDAEDKYFDS
jgi:hypothetical protein